jgi:hypothetical protein
MNVVRTKPGVEFSIIAPGGFKILSAIVAVAEKLGHDLTITSGTDGEHSGPNDPHHRGEAYDVRVHDLPDPTLVLQTLQAELDHTQFFSFLEDPGSENEHLHVQVKKGTTCP